MRRYRKTSALSIVSTVNGSKMLSRHAVGHGQTRTISAGRPSSARRRRAVLCGFREGDRISASIPPTPLPLLLLLFRFRLQLVSIRLSNTSIKKELAFSHHATASYRTNVSPNFAILWSRWLEANSLRFLAVGVFQEGFSRSAGSVKLRCSPDMSNDYSASISIILVPPDEPAAL